MREDLLPGRRDFSELHRARTSPVAAIAKPNGGAKKLSAADAKKRFTVSRNSADGSWRLRYLGPGKVEDVFAEAPERSSLKARARERASSLSSFPEAKRPRPPTRR
jgi:hypothetical protein